MKKIAKLLKADLNGTSDLAAIASMLQGKGRGKDTILAHITPREADILKAAGGSGTTNPETGLLEFQEVDSYVGEPYTTVYDPPSYDIGFGPDVYEAPGGGQFGPSPTNAEIEQQIGYQPTQVTPQAAPTSAYTGGGLRAKPGLPDIPAEGLPGVRSLAYQGGAIVPPPAPVVTTPSGEIDIGFGAGKYAPAPQEKPFFDKMTTEQMVRLGLAGGLGIYGAQQAKKGGQQAQQAATEQRAVGAPYQAKGQELQRAAQAGELTLALTSPSSTGRRVSRWCRHGSSGGTG